MTLANFKKYSTFAFNAASAPIAGVMLAGLFAVENTKEKGFKGAMQGLVVAPVVFGVSTVAMVIVNIDQLKK